MSDALIRFIREQYSSKEFIPLHAPTFQGHEREYILDTIESTFVSSVGMYVDRFEREVATYTGSPKAIATVNGTAALHLALLIAGVKPDELVITQPLTFVATCNAIRYCGAEPVFVDVDKHRLSLSPTSLDNWLHEHAQLSDEGVCLAKTDSRVIRACLPMHTFGHPADLEGLMAVCKRWNLALVEDAAESLGSFYRNHHTGTFGVVGTLSFNGNKIITTGGGGMILTNETLGERAKHLSTTAKTPHAYEYIHDAVGYNYRLPNLNAALGCAQLEQLEAFILSKRLLANRYIELLKNSDLQFVAEPAHCRSNYWLNAVICENKQHRDALLKSTNDRGVGTRPLWALMHRLPMFSHSPRGDLTNAEWLEARVVNLPSSAL